jgi:hypothetical protein
MRNIIKYLLFILILVALQSCQKEYITDRNQKVLFEFSYVNYAWGEVNTGFYIDTDGNILEYENPENWNFSEQDNNLTSEQVEENLSFCMPSGLKIRSEELRQYINYIDNLARSRISAPVHSGADMGSLRMFCFEYMREEGSYRPVLIKWTGDYQSENLNFYAKKVSEWLQGINNELTRPD